MPDEARVAVAVARPLVEAEEVAVVGAYPLEAEAVARSVGEASPRVPQRAAVGAASPHLPGLTRGKPELLRRTR